MVGQLRTALTHFFGFFRAGEITIPSATAYDSQIHLSWGDVAIDNPASPTCVRAHLKQSKTDPLGRGVNIYIGPATNELCPVQALLAYVASRGTHAGPFFCYSASMPLIKSRFIGAVREALQQVRLMPTNYAGHSFRIGAATTAAVAVIEDSLVQTLGRWSSAAFISYIRTPPTQLMTTADVLSCTVSH